MEMLFPTVEHKFCVKHIYNNFKLNFNGLELKAALWSCVAAIYKNLERLEDYVHACYRKDAYVAAYKKMITPLPGQDEWVETNQPAPVVLIVYKLLGTPPMKRKKDADEPNNPYKVSRSYRPIKCGFYHQEGHNLRRCKVGITGETPWQRR